MQSALLTNPSARSKFRGRLLAWYDANRRNLPWREANDPYQVWISEIMLQQTRVAAVESHYRTFIGKFPDVNSLAAVPLDKVLAGWSGLGYYGRARHLHQAAQYIVTAMAGRLPTSAAAWQQLPGIGRYTANAIASIAFGEPCAVVDGNVERVLRRLLGDRIDRREHLWKTADLLLCKGRPGDFNQALMELGATVCTPQQPRCLGCPVWQFCHTRGRHRGQTKPARQKESVTYLLAQRPSKVLLVRRSLRQSVMAGMWELPAWDHNGCQVMTLKHSIMNTDYTVHVVAGNSSRAPGRRWIAVADLPLFPLTGLARKILCRSGILQNQR